MNKVYRCLAMSVILALLTMPGASAQVMNISNISTASFPDIKANITIVDAKGDYVNTLKPEDFEITINGITADATAVSCPPVQQPKLSIVLTNDRSESMNWIYYKSDPDSTRIKLVGIGGAAFISAIDWSNTMMAITSFSTKAILEANFTNFPAALYPAVSLKPDTEVLFGTNYTAAFLDPAAGAIPLLSTQSGSRIVVFLTDGSPNQKTLFNADDVIYAAKLYNIRIFPVTLAMGMSAELQRIANETGGIAFGNIASGEEARSVYKTIANLIQHTGPCAISWRAAPCDPSDIQIATIRYKPLNLQTVVSYSIKGLEHLPSVNAGADRVLCKGKSTILSTGTPMKGTYLWSPVEGLDNPASPSPVAKPDFTTLYSVTFTDTAGCQTHDDVLVSVVEPLLSLGEHTVSICKGSHVIFDVSGNGDSYQWTPTIGLNDPTLQNPIASPTQTTTYRVTMKLNTCVLTDSITVTVVSGNTGTLEADRDTAVCAGSSIQLNAVGLSSGNYKWAPVEGLSNPLIHNPIAQPQQTTMYHVQLIGLGDCQQMLMDSVLVTVYPRPTLTMSAGGTICSGQSIPLEAIASEQGEYQWSPLEEIDAPSTAKTSAHPKHTTTYHVRFTSKSGCSTEDSIQVKVENLLTVRADAVPAAICVGAVVQLEAVGSEPGEFYWTPEQGVDDPYAVKTFARPKQTTMYHVQMISKGGCSAQDSILVTVRPDAIVEAGKDTTICKGGLAQLWATGAGQGSYQWYPSEGLSATDISDPVAYPLKERVYHVRFTNEYGCEAEDSVFIGLRPQSAVRFSLEEIPNKGYLPGEKVPVSLYVQNSDTYGAYFYSFHVAIQYDREALRYRTGSIQTGLSGWVINGYEDEVTGQFIIEGTGTTSLQGKACSFALDVFLPSHDTEFLPLTFVSISLEPEGCFLQPESTDAKVQMSAFCTKGVRGVKYNEQPYALRQNVPNPADQSTVIDYSIGQTAQTTLILYNAMGGEVSVLHSGTQESGTYRIYLNTGSFPPGLYVYRLVSGLYSVARQLVIR